MCERSATSEKKTNKHFAAWLFYTYSFTRFTLTWYAICRGVRLCYACRIAFYLDFLRYFYSNSTLFHALNHVCIKINAPSNDKCCTSPNKECERTVVIHKWICLYTRSTPIALHSSKPNDRRSMAKLHRHIRCVCSSLWSRRQGALNFMWLIRSNGKWLVSQ